jgi:hypothetical protein
MFETVVGVPFTVYVNEKGAVPVKSTPILLETFNPQREELFVKTAVGVGLTVNKALLLFAEPQELV